MFYQDKYIAENDSLMKGQQYGMLRNIEDVVRTQVQERREAEQRHRERMLWIGLCVAVGFILLAGTAATVIAVQRRRLRQNRAALYHRNAEILNLNEHKRQAAAAEDVDSALMERATELSTHEEVVCDPKYSIAQMAQRLDVPTRILSKTINAATGENFSVFLAKARVTLAASKLSDPAFDKLTIEAVGLSVGFLSRSNFAVVFRRVTGLNPSEFRRQSRKTPSKTESDGADF